MFITSLMMSDGPNGTQFLSLDALSTCIFASQYSRPDRLLFFTLLHIDMRSAEWDVQVPVQMCTLCHIELI